MYIALDTILSALHILSYLTFTTTYEAGNITMPIFIEEEMRHKGVKYLSRWQNQDTNLEILAPQSTFVTTMHVIPPVPVHAIFF